jgi:hypothetical protein
MPTPEGKVKDRIKRLLKSYGCYQFWPVQTGYGAPTLDCIACFEGHFIGIEAKAPGKRPTPRQCLTMNDMNKAGAKVFVIGEYKRGDTYIDSEEKTVVCQEEYSGLGELEAWLLMMKG